MSMSSQPPAGRLTRFVSGIGSLARGAVADLGAGVAYIGGLGRLVGAVLDRLARWLARRGVRIRREHLVAQAIRVGVRSIPIIVLVQLFIGVILALNLAPTLQVFGQLEQTASVVAIATTQELGPLISAIILTGFAGAAIAAELGAMVEGEELKALRAHALDPIRFLVAPRVVATAFMLVFLTIIANIAAILGGFLTGHFILDVPATTYWTLTQDAVTWQRYFSGLIKALVFGAVIAVLACYEGLNVSGGAQGVGKATTTTVVKSIVALIGADLVFTIIFYAIGWL